MALGNDEAGREADLPSGRERAALVTVLLGAVGLRLAALDRLPPGLHVDEAFNILDARAIRDGWRPIFLPANAGREAAYSYLQAVLFALGGDSLAVARLASACLGIATVAALWLAVRRLPVPGSRRVAILAAAALAVNLWHLHFSRFAIRSIALPLLVIGVWSTWNSIAHTGRRHERRRPARVVALAGWLGVGLYVHPAARLLWALPAASALVIWWRDRDRAPGREFLAAVLGALALALPLLLTWMRAPWLILGHTAETSILGAGPEALIGNLAKALGLFLLAGDPAPWRNAPGRPAFDPLTGLFFLAGLVLVLREVRRSRWATTAIIALVVLLLPTVVTDAAPNFSRSIGVLPLACLLVALAVDRLASLLEDRQQPILGRAAIVLWLLVAGSFSIRDYAAWMAAGQTPLAFDDEKAALGQYAAAQHNRGAMVFVSPVMAVHPTFRVLAPGAAPGFDPDAGLLLPPAAVHTALYTYLHGEPELEALATQALDLRLYGIAQGSGHLAHARAVDVATARRIALRQGGLAVDFGDSLQLRRVSRPPLQAGTTAILTLAWEVLATPSGEWNRTVRLERPDGRVIAQTDGPPLGGSWPTSRWQPGELVLDELALELPAYGSGPAAVRVGWYDWRTLAAIPTQGGESLAEVDSWEVGR